MNYSNMLYIAIAGIFFASIATTAMESQPKRLTIAERRQRGLTEEQEKQSKIKETTEQVNVEEIKEFKKPQKPKKKIQWNCCK